MRAYPFTYDQRDAIRFLSDAADGKIEVLADFIWASPPCQAFTAYKRRPGHVRPRENLIAKVRKLLERIGKPYCIENVPGAPLRQDLVLCGSMFGLDVRRHRIFETNFPVRQPECRHHLQLPRFPPATNRKNLRRTVEVGVWRIPLETQRAAMGIAWMNRKEISQAIPPKYSEFIAQEFMEADKRGHRGIKRAK
jgi:DNA (cytosine-5)-methyltransferase 1